MSGQSAGSACSVATSAIARRTAPTPGLEVGARMMMVMTRMVILVISVDDDDDDEYDYDDDDDDCCP